MSLPTYSWRNFLPLPSFHYIKDLEQANFHLASLQGPVGFDIEWKPTFTKATPENPVALVQLANRHTILLIQISSMPEFPINLRNFLESPGSVKAGVGIQYDVKKLFRDCQISTRNCVDLSLLARSVDNARWKGGYGNPIGLARLVQTYENLLLSKGKISRSNWEGRLSFQQTEYAGNDAHAGFVIYERLIALAYQMEKVPKSVCYTFDAVRGILCQSSGAPWSSYNPDYDPGPPPPPKILKLPQTSNLGSASQASSTPDNLPLIVSTGSHFKPQAFLPKRYFSSRAVHDPHSFHLSHSSSSPQDKLDSGRVIFSTPTPAAIPNPPLSNGGSIRPTRSTIGSSSGRRYRPHRLSEHERAPT